MAIIIKTANPQTLLKALKAEIDNGNIVTWVYDGDGDFTHTSDQWSNQAWLRPVVGFRELKFGILGPEEDGLKAAVYGFYHGRFLEMMLNHFDQNFHEAKATALLAEPDVY